MTYIGIGFAGPSISAVLIEALGFFSFPFGIATAGGAISIIAALMGMGGAVAASYGLAFLKERLEPNQVVEVLLSLLGFFTLPYLGG
jgi:uncharacterized membrane protein